MQWHQLDRMQTICPSLQTQWRCQGKLPPVWVDVQKLCNMCVLSLSWNFFVSHDIHCKAVEQRATLIHRQYNWDWGISYSRLPIDPYLTAPPLLQNSGGATVQTDNHTNTSSVITQFLQAGCSS